ncbi:hypothetical protein [Vibrio phage vB_VmeM-Yong XC32]|nr:hypothetical protein [Vibrio phage vB_VmeM-Yong XC31]QAX96427.1 hypothetical protein [Vibrio phage vB_VmeM-Yong XC32]QAX96744.1 hypothetical protein [Vibrio phage vB_VmeM-Yong MS31]QAX97063.1 hypothetical protein [Vibrio phage vB_VmeM-Yong MS32]
MHQHFRSQAHVFQDLFGQAPNKEPAESRAFIKRQPTVHELKTFIDAVMEKHDTDPRDIKRHYVLIRDGVLPNDGSTEKCDSLYEVILAPYIIRYVEQRFGV